MFAIFDLLFIITTLILHTTSLYLSYIVVIPLWSQSLFFNVFTIILGYFLFLHFFTLQTGLLRLLFQPKLKEGSFSIGLNKGYVGWVLNSLIQGVFISSPFAQQCLFIFYLKWAYYRLMGMKVSFKSLIGMHTIIRQAELIEIGKKTVIGLGAALSCHYSPSSKIHIQRSVKIGDNCVIGGFAIVGAGSSIGNNTVIGAKTNLLPNVSLGNNVKIGGNCNINFGVAIPDNVKIKSHTVITKNDQINSGEIWAGHPAKKVGLIEDIKGVKNDI
ncbi:MAG: hypothetical protein CME66_10090 [Halobacteriovoraceae bacterium]|nr:hypothetical protein [Halobacteriovoraceae bacterium]|tara:strand:+ start:576 stop:1391 length:816 start_codon:yes stop_codon:yes gene_type:complete